MHPVRVRAAAVSDIPGIAAMVECYWRIEAISGFDRRAVETTLAALLSRPEHGACWVADDDGALLGYLTAVYMLSLEHGGWMAEIDEFFVHTAQRSQGVGMQLIAAAELDMAARGVLRLQLQLKRGNERARAFYERLGFRRRADYELFDKPLRGELKGDSG
jgi:GNAT superfamily N-acetyltransferase